MKIGKFAALCLSGVLAASVLTGCGGVNKDDVLATFNGEEITVGVANFAARLQQASYDDIYTMYFGEDSWHTDMYGNGETLEDSLKSSVISALQAAYTLQAHADEYGIALTDEEKTAISETATAFIGANSDEALEAMGATQEIVEEYLTLITIQNKMYDAVIAEADTEVSDAQASTGAYSYVSVSTATYKDAEGNSVEYTEDELELLKIQLDELAAQAVAEDLETAAEAAGYTVSTGTFSSADLEEGEEPGELETLLRGMEDGEVSDVVEIGGYYYVVRLDAMMDADATESTRQNIIEERQSEYYSEVLTAWEEESGWELNERVWNKVSFDNLFTTIVESTETIEDSENAVETTEQ